MIYLYPFSQFAAQHSKTLLEDNFPLTNRDGAIDCLKPLCKSTEQTISRHCKRNVGYEERQCKPNRFLSSLTLFHSVVLVGKSCLARVATKQFQNGLCTSWINPFIRITEWELCVGLAASRRLRVEEELGEKYSQYNSMMSLPGFPRDYGFIIDFPMFPKEIYHF